MACGCNTSTTTGTYNAYPGRPSCPLPVRTSTTPTVPQRFSQLPRLVPKQDGKLLVGNGDEMNALDSPVDGVVLFDSVTGKVYVGDFEVTSIPDNYGCTTTTTYGFPVYGVRPECGTSSEFPSRDLGMPRPVDSSIGTLWAHQRSCGGIGGPAQELTPVEIVPDPWPGTIPDGMMNLSFVKTDASQCGSTQYQFYANPGQVVVPNVNLLTFGLPVREFLPADDADFRFPIYAKLDSGHFILKGMSPVGFQDYIDDRIDNVLTEQGFTATYLNPRQALVQYTHNELYSYTYGPFNLTGYSGYNANSKEIQLFIAAYAMVPAAETLRYAFYIRVNGVIKYTGFAGEDPTGFRGTGEIHVPIPADKLLVIDVVKEIYAGGPAAPANSAELEIYLEAFK